MAEARWPLLFSDEDQEAKTDRDPVASPAPSPSVMEAVLSKTSADLLFRRASYALATRAATSATEGFVVRWELLDAAYAHCEDP